MHGIAAFALAGVHALGDDRSSLILTRIAAGKEDGNDADADNTARDAGYPCILLCAP